MKAPFRCLRRLSPLLVFPLAACVETPYAAEEGVGKSRSNLMTENALSPNGLLGNGLITNGVDGNGLLVNGLTTNGVDGNGLVKDALREPTAQQAFEYLVSCALRDDQCVSVDPDGKGEITFCGSLGLAEAWGEDGAFCDETCQEWVSACMIARVNYLGHHITISLRGDHPRLAIPYDAPELIDYPRYEATYYGNIFTDANSHVRRACSPTGSPLVDRVCGPKDQHEECVAELIGECPFFCDEHPSDGSWTHCDWPGGGRSHGAQISVFRALWDEDNAFD